jgi:hypothetical protein
MIDVEEGAGIEASIGGENSRSRNSYRRARKCDFVTGVPRLELTESSTNPRLGLGHLAYAVAMAI